MKNTPLVVYFSVILIGLGCKQAFADADKDDLFALRKALAALDIFDPSADVREKTETGDHRPVALMGFSIIIPGIRDYQLAGLPGGSEELAVLPGTSDNGTDELFYLMDLGRRYAERYNRLLIDHLKKSGVYRPTALEQFLASHELAGFNVEADIQAAVAHLVAELKRQHPGANIPTIRVGDRAVASSRKIHLGAADHNKSTVLEILERFEDLSGVIFFFENEEVHFGR